MFDWIKLKVIDAIKGKALRLLAEQSTRKAIISLAVGVTGYSWTDGKIDAAATLLGASYAFLSLIMEDKKPVPSEVKTPPMPVPEMRDDVVEEAEPDALTINGKPWDGKTPGQFP